jgi:alpha-tubulin suppressor-like RCC1 family protein
MRALLLISLAFTSCSFDIDHGDGLITCGTGGLCPDGLQCRTSTNKCVAVVGGGTKMNGEACGGAGECSSGNCADGVCCNAICDGQCETCSATPGTCTPVTGAPAVTRAACNGTGTSCGGMCDGTNRASCSYPTTSCAAPGCTTNVYSPGSTCDMGTCTAGATMDCSTTTNTKYCTTHGCLGVTQLALGYQESCALMSDLTVMCWGDNTYGQMGQGNLPGTSTPDTDERDSPVFVTGLTDIIKVSVGTSDNADDHMCALKSDKSVWCWGSNFYGELGIGMKDSPTGGVAHPTPLAMKQNSTTTQGNVNDLSTGKYFTCFVDTAAKAWCVGENESHQLGDNSATAQQVYPVQAGSNTDYSLIWSGYDHTCATVPGTSSVRCWGSNSVYQSGFGTVGTVATPTDAASFTTLTAVSTDPKKIGTGYTGSCAIANNSVLNCWGYNGRGQLGRGCDANGTGGCTAIASTATASYVCKATPCASNQLNLTTSFGISEQSACAISNGSLYCWGKNTHGEFGDGAGGTAAYFAKQITAAGSPVEVATGAYHTCVRYSDNTIKCVGWNDTGQIGAAPVGGDIATWTSPKF